MNDRPPKSRDNFPRLVMGAPIAARRVMDASGVAHEGLNDKSAWKISQFNRMTSVTAPRLIEIGQELTVVISRAIRESAHSSSERFGTIERKAKAAELGATLAFGALGYMLPHNAAIPPRKTAAQVAPFVAEQLTLGSEDEQVTKATPSRIIDGSELLHPSDDRELSRLHVVVDSKLVDASQWRISETERVCAQTAAALAVTALPQVLSR